MPLKIDLDEPLMKELYLSGLTIYEIGDLLECNRETVRSRLIKIGVKMRPRRQYQYKYDINVESFKEITDEDSAYWLGFMFADGYVLSNRRTFGVNLSTRDRNHLELFKDWLRYQGPIHDYINDGHPQSILSITRPCVAESLISHGCIPRKTGRTERPKGLSESMIRHFVRGLFDGDGSVTIGSRNGHPRLTASLVGDYDILEWVAEKSPVDFAPPRKNSKANVFSISADGSNKPREFLEWIYDDCSTKLHRKSDKLQIWNDRRSNESQSQRVGQVDLSAGIDDDESVSVIHSAR